MKKAGYNQLIAVIDELTLQVAGQSAAKIHTVPLGLVHVVAGLDVLE